MNQPQVNQQQYNPQQVTYDSQQVNPQQLNLLRPMNSQKVTVDLLVVD